MFPISELNSNLKLDALPTKLFDFYRLVDVQTHDVLEYSDDSVHLVDTHDTCHHIWGTEGPCANCTSRTCVERWEPIIKIMGLERQYLLIYSVPVKVDGKPYALELIKDITHSLMVPSVETGDNLEVVDMIRQFNRAAVRDSFTHLYNKTYTLNELQNIIDECELSGEQPTCELVMFDIDLFKNINDTLGHTIGDDVLMLFAKELSVLALKFEGGWAARYGGDEFILCAPEGLGQRGYAKIIASLDSFASDVQKNAPGVDNVSVSFGKALLQKGDSNRGFIDRADKEMYKMKEEHHKELLK